MILVAAVCAVLLIPLARRRSVSSPAGIAVGLSLFMSIGLLVLPLGFYPVSIGTALIWIVGLITFVAFHFLAARTTRRWGARRKDWRSLTPISEFRLALVAGALLMAQVFGVFAYRERITALSGASFSSLELGAIRVSEGVDGGFGGAAALLFAVSPLLAFTGVLGALMVRKWWGILVAVAVMSAASTPGRTSLLLTLATALLSWWYVRTCARSRPPKPATVALMASLTAVGAMVYFNYVADKLNKAFVGSFASDSWLPEQFHSAALYLLGGPPALSVAMEGSTNPVAGYEGRSVYVFVKVLALFNRGIVPPETKAEYVAMPALTNAYTGFGDAWFDGGVFGLIFVFASYGILSGWSFTSSRFGSLPALWISALLGGLVTGLPVAGHLFELPIVGWMVVGAVCMHFLTVPARVSPSNRSLQLGEKARGSRLHGLAGTSEGPTELN